MKRYIVEISSKNPPFKWAVIDTHERREVAFTFTRTKAECFAEQLNAHGYIEDYE